MGFDDFQHQDLPHILSYLGDFWRWFERERATLPVAPTSATLSEEVVGLTGAPLPTGSQPLHGVLSDVDSYLRTMIVNTGSPLFLGYVTTPSLDIASLGVALAAVTKQNVAFRELAPAGDAFERAVIAWLGEIVGYDRRCGGVLVSGGSMANLYGLVMARSTLFGPVCARTGNPKNRGLMRVYCSEHTHVSVRKAAALMGLGTDAVREISTGPDHRLARQALVAAIEADLSQGVYVPGAIIGNAGTRDCCAFDDLGMLREVADSYRLWFHADAAFGGPLRLATVPPAGIDCLGSADSVAINPHKMFFVPFECGCILTRRPESLEESFSPLASAYPETDASSFTNLGIEMGRGMRALPSWLALRRFGAHTFGREYDRLLQLVKFFVLRVRSEPELELVGPTEGIAACFRWRTTAQLSAAQADLITTFVAEQLRREGHWFLNTPRLDGRSALRVCMTNFRTEQKHLDALIARILTEGRAWDPGSV